MDRRYLYLCLFLIPTDAICAPVPILAPVIVVGQKRTPPPAPSGISKSEIKGSSNIGEALSSNTTEAIQSGSPGRLSQVYYRGLRGRHTRVEFDGIPLNDPSTGGSTDLSQIPTAFINSATLKSSSALVGSGGAYLVSLESPQGQPQGWEAEIAGGSRNSRQGSLLYSDKLKEDFYTVGIQGSIQGLGTQENPLHGNIQNDGFKNQSIILGGGRRGKEIELSGTLMAYQSILQDDAFVDGLPQASNSYYKTTRILGRLKGTLRRGPWTSSLSVGGTRNQSEPYQYPINQGDLYKTSLTTQYKTAGHTLEGELMGLWEHYGAGDTNYQRGTFGMRLSDSLELSQSLTLDVGARVDTIQTVGWVPSGVVGLRKKLGPLQFTPRIRRSFAAPSLFELYGTSPHFIPNPNLRSETTHHGELEILYTPKDSQLSLSLTPFMMRSRDTIQNDTLANNVSRPINKGTLTSKGIEAQGQYKFDSGITVKGGYTCIQGSLGDSGPVFKLPKHRLQTSLKFPFWEGCVGEIRGKWVSSQLDSGGRSIKPFGVIDLEVTKTIKSPKNQIEIFGRLQNLTDHRYEESYGYLSPRLGIHAGIRFKGGKND